jgi:hypothetical protein
MLLPAIRGRAFNRKLSMDKSRAEADLLSNLFPNAGDAPLPMPRFGKFP